MIGDAVAATPWAVAQPFFLSYERPSNAATDDEIDADVIQGCLREFARKYGLESCGVCALAYIEIDEIDCSKKNCGLCSRALL